MTFQFDQISINVDTSKDCDELVRNLTKHFDDIRRYGQQYNISIDLMMKCDEDMGFFLLREYKYR